MPKAKGTRMRGRDSFGGPVLEPPSGDPTLAEIGVHKKRSAQCQKLAAVPLARSPILKSFAASVWLIVEIS
jgi:hypothetical protein